MRFATALLIIAAGCNTPAGDFFTPDEFHLWGEYGEDRYSSEFNRPGSPTGGLGSGDGERSAIGIGFTWHLTSPSAHDLDALRELQRITATLIETRSDLASFAAVKAPEQFTQWPQPLPSFPSSWRVPLLAPSDHYPAASLDDHRHDGEDQAQDEASLDKLWARIGGALFLLITAFVGWLNRQRLPWGGGSHNTPPPAPDA
jgi:hypothetical protein